MNKPPSKEDREARLARQAVEGKAAMKEYNAEFDATVARTARLRAARLAREAETPAAMEAEAPPAKAVKAAKKPAKKQRKTSPRAS